MGTAHS